VQRCSRLRAASAPKRLAGLVHANRFEAREGLGSRMGAEEDPVLQEPLLGAAAQTDTRTKNSSTDHVSESHGKTRKLLSRRWLLAGSFVMFFAANLSASLASPFLPQELMDLGASSSTVGIVFAAYPFSFFVNSLITGMQYIPWGRWHSFCG